MGCMPLRLPQGRSMRPARQTAVGQHTSSGRTKADCNAQSLDLQTRPDRLNERGGQRVQGRGNSRNGLQVRELQSHRTFTDAEMSLMRPVLTSGPFGDEVAYLSSS